MKNTRIFAWLGRVLLLSGGGIALASCSSNTTPGDTSPVLATRGPEPSVLAMAQRYARLLSQVSPPSRDSLLGAGAVPAEATILPGHYQLRFRTYVVDVQPDGVLPTVTIVPFELALPAATPPATKPGSATPPELGTGNTAAQPVPPALAVQLPALVEAFGPWQGDFYIAEEEPSRPEMHPTGLHFRNPATGHGSRITAYLMNPPAAAANQVHKITLIRDDQP